MELHLDPAVFVRVDLFTLRPGHNSGMNAAYLRPRRSERCAVLHRLFDGSEPDKVRLFQIRCHIREPGKLCLFFRLKNETGKLSQLMLAGDQHDL